MSVPLTTAPTFTLADCETVDMPGDVTLILRPGPEPAIERGIASMRQEDMWWLGHWNRKWHFEATEGDLRAMLDDALRAGEVEF